MFPFLDYLNLGNVSSVVIFSVIVSFTSICLTIYFMRKAFHLKETNSSDYSEKSKENSTTDGSTSEDADESSNTDRESESDLESNVGLVGRFKTAQIRKLQEQLTEDQKKTEEEAKREQLAAIFELVKRQQEQLNTGQMEENDIKAQLGLYLNR